MDVSGASVLVTGGASGLGAATARRFAAAGAQVFGLDLQIAEAELTHAFWNPEMAHLRELAEASMKTGHENAAEHGLRIAKLSSV